MTPTDLQRQALQNRPHSCVVMRQRWDGLGFFHWEIDSEFIAARLPKGLYVDTFEGKAYLGVVPFFMKGLRPVCLPPLPGLSWFRELNLRTYVYDKQGNPGVWFFSLDCEQPIAVEIARHAFHLPYQHARMGSSQVGNTINYYSHRKRSEFPTAHYSYPIPQNPQPALYGSLEWFLVERYLLYSTNRHGRIYAGRVHHSPYLIEAAPQAQVSPIPFLLNDFPEPVAPPVSSLCASAVDVTVFPLRRIS